MTGPSSERTADADFDRERLRRAVEDGERLYRVRMHGEYGETIAAGNRIDGILTIDLPDALGLVDRLVARNQQLQEALEIIASRGVPSHLTPYGSVRAIAAYALGKADDPFYRDGDKLHNATQAALASVRARTPQ